jgi:hypothetical protein
VQLINGEQTKTEVSDFSDVHPKDENIILLKNLE